jgi:hypothetical protein
MSCEEIFEKLDLKVQQAFFSDVQCLSENYRCYLYEPYNEEDSSLSYFTKQSIERFLTFLEYDPDLLNEVKTNQYILKNENLKNKLAAMVFKWEPIISKLGNTVVDNYFLRNRLINDQLYDFLNTFEEISLVSEAYPNINVLTKFSYEEFSKIMEKYDKTFENYINYKQGSLEY